MWIFGRNKKQRPDPAKAANSRLEELGRQTEEARARTAQMTAEREARNTPPDNADAIRSSIIDLTELTNDVLEQMGLDRMSDKKRGIGDERWSVELFTHVLQAGSAAHTLKLLRERPDDRQSVSQHMQVFFVQTIAETAEVLLPAVKAQKNDQCEREFIKAVTEAAKYTEPKEGARLRARLLTTLDEMGVKS